MPSVSCLKYLNSFNFSSNPFFLNKTDWKNTQLIDEIKKSCLSRYHVISQSRFFPFKINYIKIFITTAKKTYFFVKDILNKGKTYFFSKEKDSLFHQQSKKVIDSELTLTGEVKPVETKINSSSFLQTVFEKGLLKRRSSAVASPLHRSNSVINASFVALNYGFIPWKISQNLSNPSLVSTLRTATVMQNVVSTCFNQILDKQTLEKYDLVLQGDTVDHYLFQGTTLLISKSVHLLADHQFSPSLHFAVAFLSTFPPLQNAMRRSCLGKQLSQRSHHLLNQTHQLAKKPLTSLFKKSLVFYLQRSGTRHANHLYNYSKSRIESQIEEIQESPFFSDFSDFLNLIQSKNIDSGKKFKTALSTKNQIFKLDQLQKSFLGEGKVASFAKTLLSYHVVEPVAKKIPVFIDNVADALAEKTLHLTTSYAKKCFEVYFCNRSLVMTMKKHPLLGSLALVANGGINQDFQELLIRVSGAGIMILTDSAFWPTAFIYSAKAVNYGVKLRAKYIENKRLPQDFAVSLPQKRFLLPFTKASSFQYKNQTALIRSLSVFRAFSFLEKTHFNLRKLSIKELAVLAFLNHLSQKFKSLNLAPLKKDFLQKNQTRSKALAVSPLTRLSPVKTPPKSFFNSFNLDIFNSSLLGEGNSDFFPM